MGVRPIRVVLLLAALTGCLGAPQTPGTDAGPTAAVEAFFLLSDCEAAALRAAVSREAVEAVLPPGFKATTTSDVPLASEAYGSVQIGTVACDGSRGAVGVEILVVPPPEFRQEDVDTYAVLLGFVHSEEEAVRALAGWGVPSERAPVTSDPLGPADVSVRAEAPSVAVTVRGASSPSEAYGAEVADLVEVLFAVKDREVTGATRLEFTPFYSEYGTCSAEFARGGPFGATRLSGPCARSLGTRFDLTVREAVFAKGST